MCRATLSECCYNYFAHYFVAAQPAAPAQPDYTKAWEDYYKKQAEAAAAAAGNPAAAAPAVAPAAAAPQAATSQVRSKFNCCVCLIL